MSGTGMVDWDAESALGFAADVFGRLGRLLGAPEFYAQLGLIALALALARLAAGRFKQHAADWGAAGGPGLLAGARRRAAGLGEFAFYLPALGLLSVAHQLGRELGWGTELTRPAVGLALLLALHAAARRLLAAAPLIALVFKWGLLPIAALQVFGVFDETVALLDRIGLRLGNIHVTATGILRVLIFGTLLFWLGRLSAAAGTRAIRARRDVDEGAREVLAKLFEVGLYGLVFVLLLQVMGVNLTALAVFSGALGVGLGFGLQSIASNFISGIIILLDRSIKVGDYIEMEDGRAGVIRELNMRYTLLETFAGREIMVPNETFISSSFVNCTHTNPRQRYDITFSVAYDTDIRRVVELVREKVRAHPQVLSGDDYSPELQPDCEIAGFGDSGVEMLVEFWMDGIDDGRNHVGADLMMSIFEALRDNGVVIPFPQREVRVLEARGAGTAGAKERAG